jgi:Ca2+-binding EF-hand superfamily protein
MTVLGNFRKLFENSPNNLVMMKNAVKSKKEKPEETIDKPREVFNLFDKVQDISDDNRKLDTLHQDGDGSIPTREVGTALRAMMTYPSVSLTE